MKQACTLAYSSVPFFVYYTNYGNLGSGIYLPHVIANVKHDDLGAKKEAKVGTLKVLFDFVGLKPDEIFELGRDLAPSCSDAGAKAYRGTNRRYCWKKEGAKYSSTVSRHQVD